MSMLRIAHFSDTHVLSLQGAKPTDFLGKRASGGMNLALSRSRHYRVEVFEALLDAVVAAVPDHSLCTGDLVNLALPGEFERVRPLLERRFSPEALTLIPGNHDYYEKDAVAAGRFEETFAPWLPDELSLSVAGSSYPVSRQLPGWLIVGLSSAIATTHLMATGRLGRAQLEAMSAAFRDAPAESGRLLMLHHPIFPDPTRRLEFTRRLEDADALHRALAALGDAGPDLVIHGHNHAFRRQQLASGAPVVQVASASRAASRSRDLARGKRAEFHIYLLEEGRLKAIERHIHEPDEGRFVPCDESGNPLVT